MVSFLKSGEFLLIDPTRSLFMTSYRLHYRFHFLDVTHHLLSLLLIVNTGTLIDVVLSYINQDD